MILSMFHWHNETFEDITVGNETLGRSFYSYYLFCQILPFFVSSLKYRYIPSGVLVCTFHSSMIPHMLGSFDLMERHAISFTFLTASISHDVAVSQQKRDGIQPRGEVFYTVVTCSISHANMQYTSMTFNTRQAFLSAYTYMYMYNVNSARLQFYSLQLGSIQL